MPIFLKDLLNHQDQSLAPPPPTLDLLFLGTGPAGRVPDLPCLLEMCKDPRVIIPDGEARICKCCKTTREGGEEGRRNTRRQVGAVVRKTFGDGRVSNVMIDCGMTFLESAMKEFPKYGIKKLDGVIISHDHSDHFGGLGDLRSLTFHSAVQETVHVYCSEATMRSIEKEFPYLLPGGQSKGSGLIVALEFHVVPYGKTFDVAGIEILPLPVQHGVHSPASAEDYDLLERAKFLDAHSKKVPYWVQSYVIDQQIVYMSDVNAIPETTWDALLFPETLATAEWTAMGHPLGNSLPPTKATKNARRPIDRTNPKTYPLLVVDCCNLRDLHLSHFGLDTAMDVVLRMKPARTLLVGMCHEMCNSELVAIGEELDGVRHDGTEEEFVEMALCDVLAPPQKVAKLKLLQPHVRPAYDGMLVSSIDQFTQSQEMK